jgi:hypothetical protein
MHFTVLDELLLPNHCFKLLAGDEKIVLSVHFPLTRLAGGEADTKSKFIQVLGFDSVNQRAFPSTTWANDNKRLILFSVALKELLVVLTVWGSTGLLPVLVNQTVNVRIDNEVFWKDSVKR